MHPHGRTWVVSRCAALAIGPRLQLGLPTAGLNDVQRKRHPIAHLAGLGQRRQDFCLCDRQLKVRLPSTFFEHIAHPIDRHVAAVNWRKHGID